MSYSARASEARYSLASENFSQPVFTTNISVYDYYTHIRVREAPEIMEGFQELQQELQTFLNRHIHDTTTHYRNLVKDAGQSNGTSQGYDKDSKNYTTRVPVPTMPTLNQEHAHALRTFLALHSMNLQTLQNALREPPQWSDPEIAATIKDKNANDPPSDFEALNSQFNMQLLESTFTAALIVSFLSLVLSLIPDASIVTFNIGMFFALVSVGIHFGNIVISGRGIALTAQTQTHKLPAIDFRHYLDVCEQLQFAATLIFILSTIIMTFIMFSSIIYPGVLLGLSVVGVIVVFTAVYWEFSMTFHNFKLLAKNIGHLRKTLQKLGSRPKSSASQDTITLP